MNQFEFIPVAHANPESTENELQSTVVEETGAEHKEGGGGLSIEPSVIAFQILNFVVLLVLLNLILYKPLTKLLADREKRIKEGVENAEKADVMLKESNIIKQDILKNANSEAQTMIEKGRKAGEEVKTEIIDEAQKEADKIIKSGHSIVEIEKAKTAEELKASAAGLIVKTVEKILKEKVDGDKDLKLIQESLNNYSA